MSYAGIDVGTSGCKMVIYDEKGHILASAVRTYSQGGKDGHRELDPVTVIREVEKVIKEAAALVSDPIEALAVCSMGESIVCLDKAGNSLIPSMLTGDNRGIKEAAELEKQISREEVHKITGLPLSELYALPKWIWIDQNTDVFRQVEHIFFYEDYVGWMLTGERKVSYSSAARSMAFDIQKGCWSERMLAFAHLTPDRFSKPVPSGTVLGYIQKDTAKRLGLSEKTLVVAGGHDQSCCALGCGAIDEASGEDGQGTCEVMEFVLSNQLSNDIMLRNDIACAPHVIPGKYLAQIELPNCGILMNWFRDNVFSAISEQCRTSGISFYDYMDQQLPLDRPGSIYVFPSFGSSGNPDTCNDARGTIWGLTIQSTPFEIFQGLKEGMAYQIYLAFQAILQLGVDPRSILVSGGGSKSKHTMQLRADVFGIPMSRTEDEQAGTLACAMLSKRACHPDLTFEQLVQEMVPPTEVFYPRNELHQEYQRHFLRYRDLYERTLDVSNHPYDF